MSEMTDALEKARSAKKKIAETFRRNPNVNGVGIARWNDRLIIKVNIKKPGPLTISVDEVPVLVEVVGTIKVLN